MVLGVACPLAPSATGGSLGDAGRRFQHDVWELAWATDALA